MNATTRSETTLTEEEFAGLADSWDELVRSMPRPSPFLLHGWLAEWWRYFGDGDALSVHAMFRGGRLTAALPLCLRRRHGLKVTEFLGGNKATLADMLLSPDEGVTTAAELAGAVAANGHDFADLFGLRLDSRLAAALPRGSLHLIERLEAPVLDLTSGWESVYQTRLSSKTRAERRRRRRRLEALGRVELLVARGREQIEPALEEAFRVHSLRWRGRRDTSGFGTPKGMEFHRAAVLRLADQDIPRLVTLRLDRSAIAFALYLQLERTLYGLIMAFDPEFGQFSPGWETLLCALETADAEGVERVEFLGAAAEHKQRLADRIEPIYEGVGLASTIQGRAAAEALVGGIRVRRRLKRYQRAQKLYQRVPRLKQD